MLKCFGVTSVLEQTRGTEFQKYELNLNRL